ncbi:terpenoid synthase [Stereum hirsutum FP-91666 SS1]|uniref:terpenoid synthase n=1 Tax=Stereum hirsutum (strain FP-91666) TaxID=721885 RepID=UPI0004449AEC|nr:terpenoid synthase [Stereum hirsutum FP-91666 SS1]EIM81486.1 terpenoid synthase [Stereum hirsutum FP-91666 SS1]
MELSSLRPFPASFVLPNLANITRQAFNLKLNPHSQSANSAMKSWFKSFHVYDEQKSREFLEAGKFDLYAALSFPDADLQHLETCLAFFFWAFSTDDLSDEGDLQSKPEEVQVGVDISTSALSSHAPTSLDFPYAAMLQSLFNRIKTTATKGASERFIQAFKDWSSSQVMQSRNRSKLLLPSVEDFILMRRNTIGAALVEAMIEYSLDLDLPDYVFRDPVVIAMSEATTDIMTWPNDLCSFNKEQADGDYQNLVCCLMAQYDLGLQDAVDRLVGMISTRVRDYITLKEQLPLFGAEVDTMLRKYHAALEHYVQGTIVWYYSSPRYFHGEQIIEKESTRIILFSKASSKDCS